MKYFLQTILTVLAKLTLARFKPRVVGITGSVGKTSTKEAVALVLSSKYKTRSSQENYNNEIGLPLSILGEASAGRNLFGWLWIMLKSLLKLPGANYPEVLVLEMGTDHPGDIAALIRVVGKLNAAIITDIGISHLEFFASPQALAREKLSILRGLTKQGTAVLNFDNQKIIEGAANLRSEVMSFGMSNNAHVYASDFRITEKDEIPGTNFKIHYNGTVVPFFIPNVFGRPVVYAALAATAVGLKFGLNLVQIAQRLESFNPPPGRLRLLAGIKKTQILDDTYNAAPASSIAALEALKSIARGRKIAALGDMAELGAASEQGYREVGTKIVEYGIDVVFLVGTAVSIIEDELRLRKFGGSVFRYDNSGQAGIPLQNFLLPGDTVLIKGSQSSRMEKIVKEIMADPLNADKLLVRQSEKWLAKL